MDNKLDWAYLHPASNHAQDDLVKINNSSYLVDGSKAFLLVPTDDQVGHDGLQILPDKEINIQSDVWKINYLDRIQQGCLSLIQNNSPTSLEYKRENGENEESLSLKDCEDSLDYEEVEFTNKDFRIRKDVIYK